MVESVVLDEPLLNNSIKIKYIIAHCKPNAVISNTDCQMYVKKSNFGRKQGEGGVVWVVGVFIYY